MQSSESKGGPTPRNTSGTEPGNYKEEGAARMKPPLPKYCITYEIKHVLELVESLVENNSFTLKLLLFKTGSFLAFSTFSRH